MYAAVSNFFQPAWAECFHVKPLDDFISSKLNPKLLP